VEVQDEGRCFFLQTKDWLIPVANTLITVSLTLFVTWLIHSVNTAIDRRETNIGILEFMLSRTLSETRNLRSAIKQAQELGIDTVHIVHNLPDTPCSIAEYIALCKINPEHVFLLFDQARRSKDRSEDKGPFTLESAIELHQKAREEYYYLEAELANAKNKTWFSYWLTYIKFLTVGLFSPIPSLTEPSDNAYQRNKDDNRPDRTNS